MQSKCLFLFVLMSLIGITTIAQNNNELPTTATIRVVVTNFKKQPIKNAEVLFVSADQNKKLGGRTDAQGKFSIQLPAGSIYTVRLTNMKDTSNYSTIDIPALGPGEYFDAPIDVNIQYEPPKNFTLDNVQFDTGKPTLRPESFKELDEIAEYMRLKEEELYEISGHTDNVGNDQDNLKLSQERAEAVKNYLVKKGVKASRLTAKGYGAGRPIADNSTEQGRQKNRRTEVKIL
jgi:outer membrane protein OmpA-like peptidoglycan-associated protein